MSLALYPRAAPSDRLRVWIGAFQRTHAPALVWELNRVPRQPHALREIRSVRTNEMLPANAVPQNVPRAFTGVYEFTGLTSDTPYSVTVHAGHETTRLETRTLPAAVPSDIDKWFNVLLVSCFHQAEDRAGLAGTIVSQLKGPAKPHLTLLMGDQVYLDLPTLQDFRDDLVWLAEKFEADYTRNWRGPLGYEQVLAAAPSVSIPDDHEYWNNYPHPSLLADNTWTSAAARRWRKVAQAMYEGFQLPVPTKLGEPFVLDIPPVSFCLTDTRSGQDPERKFALPDAVFQQVNKWVSHVIEQKRFGVVVTGQSLFVKPAGLISGKVVDYELPDYGDFPRIITALVRFVGAGRPLMCLTGDVHWGRVVTSQDIRTGRTAIYEVISSPASLVTTLGSDQLKEVGAFIGGLFGARDPWPRHPEAKEPPSFFASDVLQGRFPCSTVHRQRGNHVVMLSFRQAGGGLDLRLRYWPIHPDRNMDKPKDVGPFHLPRTLGGTAHA